MKHYRRKNFFDKFDEQLDLGAIAKTLIVALLIGAALAITVFNILTN
jgi:hypothetical protein